MLLLKPSEMPEVYPVVLPTKDDFSRPVITGRMLGEDEEDDDPIMGSCATLHTRRCVSAEVRRRGENKMRYPLIDLDTAIERSEYRIFVLEFVKEFDWTLMFTLYNA